MYFHIQPANDDGPMTVHLELTPDELTRLAHVVGRTPAYKHNLELYEVLAAAERTLEVMEAMA